MKSLNWSLGVLSCLAFKQTHQNQGVFWDCRVLVNEKWAAQGDWRYHVRGLWGSERAGGTGRMWFQFSYCRAVLQTGCSCLGTHPAGHLPLELEHRAGGAGPAVILAEKRRQKGSPGCQADGFLSQNMGAAALSGLGVSA